MQKRADMPKARPSRVQSLPDSWLARVQGGFGFSEVDISNTSQLPPATPPPPPPVKK
jgi:hypothetical protein